MNERIKELRKKLKISQKVMAEKLNLSENYIFLMERGDRQPSDRTILDICREFNVNEQWLRTGEGEMEIKRTRNEELLDFFNSVADMPESKKAKVVTAMSRMTDEQWEQFADLVLVLAKWDAK